MAEVGGIRMAGIAAAETEATVRAGIEAPREGRVRSRGRSMVGLVGR